MSESDRIKSAYIVPDSKCPNCEAQVVTDGLNEWCSNAKCEYGRSTAQSRGSWQDSGSNSG